MEIILIPTVAILCAFAYLVVKTLARARVREMEVRERIAMIERGLVPAPEVDPGGFDRAMRRVDRLERTRGRGAGKHRRAGITLIGVGLGLMLLIGFAAQSPREGIGVGGFLAALGLAFLVNSYFEDANPAQWTPPASAGSPPSPPSANISTTPADPR